MSADETRQSAETAPKFRPGTVVRYRPDPSRHDPHWCREGMAIANDRGILLDTYWGSGSEAHCLLPVEIATVKVEFHLDDFDELDRWRPDQRLWETYAPADRQRITHQHRLEQRLFIRKGAQPDLFTQIANAEEKVREAERALESAEIDLRWARKDLAALVGQSTPPGQQRPDGAPMPEPTGTRPPTEAAPRTASPCPATDCERESACRPPAPTCPHPFYAHAQES